MTRVLVTGATGLIGRAVMPHFAALGIDAMGLTRHAAPQCISGDLFDAVRVRAVLKSFAPTHVLHLAWDVTPGQFVHGGSNLDWVAATMMFARAAADAGVRRFVGIGTCAEYDWSDGGATPRREDDRLATHSLYTIAKTTSQFLLAPFFADENISFSWARLFHLFGPGEHKSRLVGAVIDAIRHERTFVCRHGQLRRDYMAAGDIGTALALLTLGDLQGAINIASGVATPLGDLVRHIGDHLGRPELLDIRADPAPGQPAVMQADVTRMRDELGLTPRATLWQRLDALPG